MFNLNQLKKLYNNSPLWIKKTYSLIPFNLRAGSDYRKWFAKIHTRKDYEADPFTTVKYAFDTFDFYKGKYENTLPVEWESIPFLDKSETQKYLPQFEAHKSKKFYVTTGGVSGKPAKFFQSKNVWSKELAFVNSFFGQFGYAPKNLKLSLRGGDFDGMKKNIFWKWNPISNEIHFSPFHLSSKTVHLYIQEINRLQPKFFHSYPSGLLRLAQLMKEENLSLNYSPECIFLISEAFSRQEFEFLKAFFNCKVTTFYGHSERLIFAEFDEESYSYIPNPLYGYFELINESGEVIKENNVKGEIVGTSYDNYTMPLIRYKTGDFTYYVDYSKKAFGPIEGKWGQDKLVGINGEYITITALNLHSEELDDLLRIQFIQKKDGLVKVNIRFKERKTNAELNALQNLLINRVGDLITFEIDQTSNFILNKRGKTPLIMVD